MPKLGRRPWSRKKRLRQREWQYEAMRRRAFEPEAIVAIEVGLDSFHRYRTSAEWQDLGWWGRWFGFWRKLGVRSCYALNGADEFEDRMRSYAELLNNRLYSVFMGESSPGAVVGLSAWLPNT